MKEMHGKRIDKLLGDLGLHPAKLDPDEFPEESARKPVGSHTPETGTCGKTCFRSETAARKSAKRIMERGANTSFLRPYFCPECRAWHITSSRILDSSSAPKRNASRKRRNQQLPPDEP